MEKIANVPEHVAIIMDGNRRWAKKRFLPPHIGHRQGAKRLEDVLEVARDYKIKIITLYAFSTENWKRSSEEIDELFSIIKNFYNNDFKKLLKNKIKVNIIGTREHLPEDIINIFDTMEEQSKDGNNLILNIAFNYGGRQELVAATNQIISEGITEVTVESLEKYLYTAGQKDVDLLIRTSGEMRVSNFLLWQIAYAEFVVVDVLWPDFTKKEFIKCLEEYQKRNRRFGGE